MDVLSVVPIFMSAGAAALPTLVAAVTSVAAILLKPREFIQLLRKRPLVWLSVAAGIVLASFAVVWVLGATPARGARRAAAAPAGAKVDWVAVARQIIQVQQLGQVSHAGAEATELRPIILGRDASRCSYAGGAAPIKLKPYWEWKPQETMVLSTPAIAGRYVFGAGCQADVTGYTGLLACLDVETGKPLWQISNAGDDILKPFFSSPALSADGKYIVIGQGLHEDHDCALLCFDARSGQLRWSVKTPLHIESSPAILGDIAVAGCGAIEGKDGKPTGDAGHVLAVRISDGKELWRHPVSDPESSPAIDADGTVYIGSGFNGSAVVALRSAADEEIRAAHLERTIWRTPIPFPATGAITLAGDLVIAGAGNSDYVFANPNPKGLVVAMDRKTGAIRWQREFADAVLGSIPYLDGKLICPVRNGEVAALDTATGTVLWHVSLSGSAPVLAGCALGGGCVYAVSSDGFLAVLDAGDGKILEKHVLNDPAMPGKGLALSTPQIAGGRVYVGSETGGLRCFVGSGAGK